MLIRLIFAALTLLIVSGLARADDAPADHERYFIVELNDEKVGWGLERSLAAGNGDIVSTSIMHFSIARGVTVINFGTTSEFVESADGSPISMCLTTEQGPQVTTERYTWINAGAMIEHTTESGDRVRTERHKAPTSPWLTPSKIEALMQQKLTNGETTIAYASLDPSIGIKPVLTKVEVIGRKEIAIMGESVQAWEWHMTTSATPGITMTSFVDDDGKALLTELPLGGLQLTIRASSKEDAIADFLAPELMIATLLQPNRPIDNPRFSQRATYILEGIARELPDLPFTGVQRAEPDAGNALRLIIDLDAPAPAEITAEERAACLAPATMADRDDPVIASLSVQVLAAMEGHPDARKAEALRTFVASYISDKSLDIGFASASDVVRTREGDCTEHAVLLVALLRHAGIPARAVSGLVYIDEFLGEQGVFGYHMWTQALLPIDPDNPDAGETWVDLDAAISTRPFDATHIALTTSDLSGGALATSMASVARVLGNLRIKVESVEYAGAPVHTP